MPTSGDSAEAFDYAVRRARTPVDRPMKRIPIVAAERIAKEYGYDQVVIYARRVGEEPEPFGEHMTTYGVSKVHCAIAAKIGTTLKKFMGWGL